MTARDTPRGTYWRHVSTDSVAVVVIVSSARRSMVVVMVVVVWSSSGKRRRAFVDRWGCLPVESDGWMVEGVAESVFDGDDDDDDDGGSGCKDGAMAACGENPLATCAARQHTTIGDNRVILIPVCVCVSVSTFSS